MDEEQNNTGQSTAEKVGQDVNDVANAAKDVANLAKDVGTGNILGIAKDSINLLKNKKVRTTLILLILLPIIIVIVIASSVFGVFDAVGEAIEELWDSIEDFFTLDGDGDGEIDGAITIKDEQINAIIQGIESLGVDLDDLYLMGDIDYENPNLEEEKQEALKKYIKEFYEAQVVTQTLYFNLDGWFDGDKTYGTVYVYRPDYSGNEPLKYMPYDEMEGYATAGDKDAIVEYFSIDSEGELVIPYWTTTTINGESTTIVSLKSEDYKNVISQYTTSMNFFVYLAMMTKNPEFVSAVVDLVKESRIEITIFDTTRNRVETETYTYTENKKTGVEEEVTIFEGGDITQTPIIEYVYEVEESSEEKEQVTEKTTETTIPVPKITYVKTWFCEQTVTYKQGQPVVTPISEERNGDNDETLKDETEPPGDPAVGVTEVWYTNKKIVTTGSVTEITYEEDQRTDVKITVGEKGDGEKSFVGLLDEKFKIPNSSRKEKAGPTLVENAGWFFYLLQKDPSSQNLEQIVRYALYKYTGDEDYGVTDLSFFSAYEITDFVSVSSSGSLLKQYIRSWEGHHGISEDGTQYLIGEGKTVGYGVDLDDSGYETIFLNQGYSTNIGDYLPVELVDKIEDEIRNIREDEIKATTLGFNLTEYQIHALVSRAYNCGPNGWFKPGSTTLNFNETYATYWNQETDDQFEEKNNQANFSHSLYTKFMKIPTYGKDASGNSVYMEGLENRRKSEWTLFQTGYYDRLGKWYIEGGDIVATCEQITQEFLNRNAHYSVDGRKLISEDIDRCYNESQYICCATYVSMVLYKSGLLTAQQINAYNYHYTGSGGIPDMLEAAGWTQVSASEIQPGDVVNDYGEHVLIYAGDGKYWDQNSCVVSSSGSPPTRTTVSYNLSGCQIWRAP